MTVGGVQWGPIGRQGVGATRGPAGGTCVHHAQGKRNAVRSYGMLCAGTVRYMGTTCILGGLAMRGRMQGCCRHAATPSG